MSNLRRWLEWTPSENNLSDPRPSKPPKPAKPLHEVGFAGYAGLGARGHSKTFLPETADPDPATDPEATLSLVRKGQAVCLVSDLLGEHIWIVADQEDADVLQTQEPGAACYDLAEVEILAALRDPEIVREVHRFKRAFPGGRFSRSGDRGKV